MEKQQCKKVEYLMAVQDCKTGCVWARTGGCCKFSMYTPHSQGPLCTDVYLLTDVDSEHIF